MSANATVVDVAAAAVVVDDDDDDDDVVEARFLSLRAGEEAELARDVGRCF